MSTQSLPTRSTTDSHPWPTHVRLAVVAAGPGDPGLMTLRGADLLRRAEIVAVDDPAPVSQLLTELAPDARVVTLGTHHDAAKAGARVAELLTQLSRPRENADSSDDAADTTGSSTTKSAESGPRRAPAADDERLLVRLLDPGADLGALGHSSGADEVAAYRALGLAVDVVPGVPFAGAALAYAGLRLEPGADGETPHVRDLDADQQLELHPNDSDPGPDCEETADPELVVVVHGTAASVTATLRRLRAAGRAAGTPAVLVTGGTTTAQRTRAMTLRQAISAVAALETGDSVSEAAGAGAAAAGDTAELDDRQGSDDRVAHDHGEQVLVVVGPAAGTDPGLDWFESLPLFDWRVLVPRTQEQSASMLSRLGRYGARGDVVPTIAVQPPRNPQQLEKALAGIITGHYEWIGFTSTNAVRAIRERFDELGLDTRSLAGVKIAAVGGVTAQALREWGIEPDLVPSGPQSAAGLLQEWPAYDPDLDPLAGVLLPRADIATDTLVAGLTELGWQVDDVTAYRTVRAAPPAPEIRAAIKHGDFDAVVFTSSSTVRNLLGIAGKPHPATVVACIGPATAQTARELGLEVHVVAPTQSSAALVDALAEYGRSLAQETPEGLRTPRPRERPGRRRTVRP